MENLVVRKHILVIVVPIVLLPGALLTFVLMVALIVTEGEFLVLIPGVLTLMLVLVGIKTIDELIRFGNKKLVVDETGIAFCNWRVKHWRWEDIVEVEWKKIHIFDHLIIRTKDNQEVDISFGDIQQKITSEEICRRVLQAWKVYSRFRVSQVK